MSRREFERVPYGFTMPDLNDRGAGVDARIRTAPAEEEASRRGREMPKTLPAAEEAPPRGPAMPKTLPAEDEPAPRRPAMSKTLPAEDEPAPRKPAMSKTLPAEDEPMRRKPATPEAAPEPKPEQRAALAAGWIMGVRGECRGRDFRLYSGMNAAGCGDEFAISLSDARIGPGPAFCVSYDPMNVKFLISPGRGGCLCYVNGAFLAETRELSGHDRIELRRDEDGETPLICELVFVPLCGERFCWQRAESEA